MTTPRLLIPLLALLAALPSGADESTALFDHSNLVAWCIVPFDAAKRGPEARAAMLERLGLRRFAYDWRAEHLPHFDEELASLRRHHVELTAVWFPTTLNADAKTILDALAKHDLHPQLWVMGAGGPTTTPAAREARIEAEANRIRPIAEAAAKIGCTVALYNHGGWFGEPENQLAIIDRLKLPNVGIVYNLHHGHEHVARFARLLGEMKPHLLAINLNGTDPDGERNGRKILPLGQGSADLDLLKTILASGWRGPVGILNHTDADAEARLRDNLAGLDWLVAQLNGQPAGPKPVPASWPLPNGSSQTD